MQEKIIQSQKEAAGKMVAVAQASISHLEQVSALHMDLLKNYVAESAKLVETALDVKTPNDAAEVARDALASAQARLGDYLGASYQIAFGLHAQVTRSLEEQMTEGQEKLRSTLREAGKLMPEAGAATEAVKSAVDAAFQAGEFVRTNVKDVLSNVEKQTLKAVAPVAKSKRAA